MHFAVNSNGKAPKNCGKKFLWFIMEHHWKAEVYWKYFGKELSLLVSECILEFKKDHTFQLLLA